MNDLISRQAAIDDIRTMIPKDVRLDIKWIEMWLKQLPSAQSEQLEICPIYDGVCGYPSDQCYDCPRHHGAQPERKTGRWIENEYEYARELWDAETKCSLCGYVLGGAKPNFCPNCGARMKS